MYPGYNFGQQMPPFGQNPIMGQLPFSPPGGQMPGQMQPLGQGMPSMGQLPPVGGPMLGQGFMQGDPNGPAKQGQHPGGGLLGQFGPMFGLAGMLAGQRGGMGMLAPMLGGLLGFGLHKAKVF